MYLNGVINMFNCKIKLILVIISLFVHSIAFAEEPLNEELSAEQADEKLAIEQMDEKTCEENVRKAMLEGMQTAVSKYGKAGGIYDDPRIRLPMPEGFKKVEKLAKKFGGKKLTNSFIKTLNSTTEKTLEKSIPIVTDYINTMPIENSKQLGCGASEATGEYFAAQPKPDMIEKMIPVINTVSEQQGMMKSLKKLLDKVKLIKLIYKIKTKIDKAIIKLVINLLAQSMKQKT